MEWAKPSSRPDVAPLAEDLPSLIDGLELSLVLGETLARPEEEESAGLESELEETEDALLRGWVQVDQKVPARDQVQPGEGRVLDQVVGSKQDHLPQVGADDELLTLLDEVTRQQRRCDVVGDVFTVDSVGGDVERSPVHICREDLDIDGKAAGLPVSVQQDRK